MFSSSRPPLIPQVTLTTAAMDDYSDDGFANRDSPVRVLDFGDRSSLSAAEDSDNNGTPGEQKRGLFKKHASNLKDAMKGHRRSDSGRSFSMQDRLLEKYDSHHLLDQ